VLVPTVVAFAIGLAVCRLGGLSASQSALFATPIGLFSGSAVTVLSLARAGEGVAKNQQLMILMSIELVLLPICCALAITAYFALRTPG
jgi:hypothetical protein